MRALFCVLFIGVAATAFAQEKPKALDADCEKVLVISDFETDTEIANPGTPANPETPAGDKRAVWIGRERAKWQAGPIVRSTEHVIHGKYSMKVRANKDSGHAWAPTVDGSFPSNWTGYDAIRFHVTWPEDKPAQWVTYVHLKYTNAEGKQDLIVAWLLYRMKPGDTEVEIPLKAYDDLKWAGLPGPGYGGGKNMTNMKLWGQDKKYDYIHKAGWKFDNVFRIALGLRGQYSKDTEHYYYIDYVRLVKWKKKPENAKPAEVK